VLPKKIQQIAEWQAYFSFLCEKDRQNLSEFFANWRTLSKRQAMHIVKISERCNFYEGFRHNN
jgi:hypothetical protein